MDKPTKRDQAAPRSLNDIHDLNTLTCCPSTVNWRRRVKELREHILTCTGLNPMPDKAPLSLNLFLIAGGNTFAPYA